MFEKLALVLLSSLVVGCGCVSTGGGATESDSKAPVLVSTEIKNKALVRVEFALSFEDKMQYPEAYDSFLLAMAEWANVAPVEFILFVPQENSNTTVAGLMVDRPGLLILDFAPEIRAPEGKNFLGTFSWASRTLRLDMGDFYKPEFKSDMAKAVALHELGHMFGLTHFYNKGDLTATAGSFIVSEGAEGMMMAPNIPKDQASVGISEIELQKALKYIETVLPTKLDRF